LDAAKNAGSTVSQNTENQKPVVSSNNIYINNKAFSHGQDGDAVVAIHRDWKPDDILATQLCPGYPVKFITDMTASFVSYRISEPDHHTKKRTNLAWMRAFAKHLEVNWKKLKQDYGEKITAWEQRGFKSESAMIAAQERAANKRLAEQFASVMRKRREANESVPPIPPHLVEFIDAETLEVVTA
jgi:hypothetical protein